MKPCAKCGVKGHVSPASVANSTSPLVLLHSVRVDGKVVKLCQKCRDRLEYEDNRPADPAKVVAKPGPQSAMRLPPTGVPLVMPREKPIEIARPLGWRRS